MKAEPQNLTGQILIAMPDMGDPRFAQSVIYMCQHSDDGAMGLIVNKPAADVTFSGLMKHLKIEQTSDAPDQAVHYGGPVERGRGFVLHSGDYHSGKGTLDVANDIGMTATVDVLEDIAAGRGPRAALLALGYAGWGEGQLEDEIAQNGWLTCRVPADIIFDTPNKLKWSASLRHMGVDPILLSAKAGRA